MNLLYRWGWNSWSRDLDPHTSDTDKLSLFFILQRKAIACSIEITVTDAPERHGSEPVCPETIDRMNTWLLRTQEQFDLVQEGFAKLANPYGMSEGEELHSEDPRITKILDRGRSLRIEYAFDTPDGPYEPPRTRP